MKGKEKEDRKEKTLTAIDLIASCLKLNNVTDSISISAMSSLISNILLHHSVPLDRVEAVLCSLNEAVTSIGSKFSRYDT